MNRNTRVVFALSSLLFLGATVSACGSSKKSSEGAAEQAAESVALGSVRVVNGTDAGAIDIAIGGVNVVSGLNQNGFTPEKLPVVAGSANVSIRANGSEIASANVAIDANEKYTFVVLGTSANGYTAALISDSGLSNAGGKNRFVHGLPNVGSVDIQANNGTTLASGLTYKKSSGFVSVPEGFKSITVKANGASLGTDSVPNNAARAVTTVVVPQAQGVRLINVIERP